MMNDTDELKARAVELAERALRLRDRATDDNTKEKLHSVNNELINLENRQRFYDAQKSLEVVENWTEDQRALAHEMSVADRQLRGLTSLSIKDTINQLFEIIEKIGDSADSSITLLGTNLRILTETGNSSQKKNALSYILGFLEDMLQHIDQDDDHQNELTDPSVLKFRNMRDSLLIDRELLYDENDLVNNYKSEGEKIDRLGLARHQLDELYNQAQ